MAQIDPGERQQRPAEATIGPKPSSIPVHCGGQQSDSQSAKFHHKVKTRDRPPAKAAAAPQPQKAQNRHEIEWPKRVLARLAFGTSQRHGSACRQSRDQHAHEAAGNGRRQQRWQPDDHHVPTTASPNKDGSLFMAAGTTYDRQPKLSQIWIEPWIDKHSQNQRVVDGAKVGGPADSVQQTYPTSGRRIRGGGHARAARAAPDGAAGRTGGPAHRSGSVRRADAGAGALGRG